MEKQRSIKVTIVRHGFRDADGVVHRRRIEVKMLVISEGLRVPPVGMTGVPHQQGGDTYKGGFHFRRRVNRIY